MQKRQPWAAFHIIRKFLVLSSVATTVESTPTFATVKTAPAFATVESTSPTIAAKTTATGFVSFWFSFCNANNLTVVLCAGQFLDGRFCLVVVSHFNEAETS